MAAAKFWIPLALTLFVAPASAEPIRLAYSGVSASGTPVWLAKEEGVFAKHGLEADLVAVRSAPLQVTALVSNEVQFVRGSASSMLTAAAQGAKLKIIFSLFAERASYDFLVAPSITKPSDLRGKKIGVQDFSGLLWSLTIVRPVPRFQRISSREDRSSCRTSAQAIPLSPTDPCAYRSCAYPGPSDNRPFRELTRSSHRHFFPIPVVTPASS
jgi:hypothetical protein